MKHNTYAKTNFTRLLLLIVSERETQNFLINKFPSLNDAFYQEFNTKFNTKSSQINLESNNKNVRKIDDNANTELQKQIKTQQFFNCFSKKKQVLSSRKLQSQKINIYDSSDSNLSDSKEKSLCIEKNNIMFQNQSSDSSISEEQAIFKSSMNVHKLVKISSIELKSNHSFEKDLFPAEEIINDFNKLILIESNKKFNTENITEVTRLEKFEEKEVIPTDLNTIQLNKLLSKNYDQSDSKVSNPALQYISTRTSIGQDLEPNYNCDNIEGDRSVYNSDTKEIKSKKVLAPKRKTKQKNVLNKITFNFKNSPDKIKALNLQKYYDIDIYDESLNEKNVSQNASEINIYNNIDYQMKYNDMHKNDNIKIIDENNYKGKLKVATLNDEETKKNNLNSSSCFENFIKIRNKKNSNNFTSVSSKLEAEKQNYSNILKIKLNKKKSEFDLISTNFDQAFEEHHTSKSELASFNREPTKRNTCSLLDLTNIYNELYVSVNSV